jgi:hypothetical protein
MTISAGTFDSNGGVSWDDVLVAFPGPAGYSSLLSLEAWGPPDASSRYGLVYEMSLDGIEPLDFQGVELAVVSIPLPR